MKSQHFFFYYFLLHTTLLPAESNEKLLVKKNKDIDSVEYIQISGRASLCVNISSSLGDRWPAVITSSLSEWTAWSTTGLWSAFIRFCHLVNLQAANQRASGLLKNETHFLLKKRKIHLHHFLFLQSIWTGWDMHRLHTHLKNVVETHIGCLKRCLTCSSEKVASPTVTKATKAQFLQEEALNKNVMFFFVCFLCTLYFRRKCFRSAFHNFFFSKFAVADKRRKTVSL